MTAKWARDASEGYEGKTRHCQCHLYIGQIVFHLGFSFHALYSMVRITVCTYNELATLSTAKQDVGLLSIPT
jgi:hypothetical protein